MNDRPVIQCVLKGADMDKKRILCFGDSNTWGVIPRWYETTVPSDRYDIHTRWPQVMAAQLGDNYEIIEEGLGGRTTIYDLPGNPGKNGEAYLLPCLQTKRPLDMVILMLGTNDLHMARPLKEEELGNGIRRLIELVQCHPDCGRGFETAKILVLAPIEVWPSDPNGRTSVYPRFYGEWATHLSRLFPKVYKEIADEYGCYFLNAALYAKPSLGDGVHMLPEGHIALGNAVAKKVEEIFAENK